MYPFTSSETYDAHTILASIIKINIDNISIVKKMYTHLFLSTPDTE